MKEFTRLISFQFPLTLWKNRRLWWRLTEREILGRYRGSLLGVFWSLLNPLLMLGVYTFVFSQVFKARWGSLENTSSLGFAVNLFAGLIVFNLFAECISRAPGLVLANPNYVKKVIFPLEILAGVVVGTAIFQALTSLIVLLFFRLIAFNSLSITCLWLPLVWLPLVLSCLSITWILAAIGVFLRDIEQVMGAVVSMLMFLSPIFFPLAALPVRWQPLLSLNPLAQVIEQTRQVLVLGEAPTTVYIIGGTLLSALASEAAYRFFKKAKRAFADVM